MLLRTNRGPGAARELHDPETAGGDVSATDGGGSPDARGRVEGLCRTCVDEAGVDGCGVSVLSRTGTPVALYATNPVASVIEELQFTLGEGPCMDAMATRLPVLVPDVADGATSRWPMYASAVQEYGVRSVFAFPLRTGAASIGVLDVFRVRPGRMTQDDVAQSLTFAEIARTTMLDGQDQAHDGDMPDGFDEAPGYRAEVFQAQGMVMMQLGVSLAEALLRMRAYAYAEGRPLADVARDVVARTLRFDEDQQ
jgi:GAF domain-containing protein